jgi:hypothetical protein
MQDPSKNIDEAETSIPTENKTKYWRMKSILRRKVAVRTLPHLPFQQPHLPFQQPHLSPPPMRAEDIPVTQRSRSDTISTGEPEVLKLPTADTMTTASLSSWVVVASSISAMGVPPDHRREWEPAEADDEPAETRRGSGKNWSTKEDAKLIAAVKKYGKNWETVASMIPGRTNVRCRAHYIWIKRLDSSTLGTTAHVSKPAAEEDVEPPNGEAVSAPTTTIMTSASSIDTEALSRTDTTTQTAPRMRMEGSRVAPPQQLQQHQDIPATKRPRFETSPPIAECEFVHLSTAETVAALLSINKVAAVRTNTTTCIEGSRVAPPQQLQQDEGIPTAKRPRFETFRRIPAVVEVIDLSMEDTVTNASSDQKANAKRTDTAMVVAGPLLPCLGNSWASARNNNAAAAYKDTATMMPLITWMADYRVSARNTQRVEAVNTWGNNGVAVASMVPDQSRNARGATMSWRPVLDRPMIDRWAKIREPTMIERSTTQWTLAEDTRLLSLVRMFGMRWGLIAGRMPGVTSVQCRRRWLEHYDHRINRETGAWRAQEDAQLTSAVISQQGHSSRVDVAAQIPTQLLNLKPTRLLYSKPTVILKIGRWTDDEGVMLTKAVKKHGKNWIAIAKEVPGRSNIQCQKRWTAAVVHNRVWATGDWTAAEDSMLTSGVAQHGRSWGMVASCVTDRSHVQCRQRYDERRLSSVVEDLRKHGHSSSR